MSVLYGLFIIVQPYRQNILPAKYGVNMALKRSDRSYLESFMVMDVMAKAAELEQMDRSIMHLEVGQPSTGAPKAASEAIVAALSDPATHG